MPGTLVTNAISEAERGDLFSIVKSKMEQACFVDWVVGVVMLAYYYTRAQTEIGLQVSDLWPAIAALGITRFGNTIVQTVRDYAYWKFHKTGERAYGEAS